MNDLLAGLMSDCPPLEIHGEPGDVVFMHSWLLHSSSPFTGSPQLSPRVVSNSPTAFTQGPADWANPIGLVEESVASYMRFDRHWAPPRQYEPPLAGVNHSFYSAHVRELLNRDRLMHRGHPNRDAALFIPQAMVGLRRILAPSLPSVSPICLGSWSSRQVLLLAYETGMNCFDTSPSYRNGESFLGDLTRGDTKHERVVVVTKWGETLSALHHMVRDYSPRELDRSVESSKQQLNVSRLPLLLIKNPDPAQVPNATFELLEQLRLQGHITQWGASVDSALDAEILAQRGATVLQYPCSLLEIPTCLSMAAVVQSHGIGAMVRGALAQGWLTQSWRDRYLERSSLYGAEDSYIRLGKELERLENVARRINIPLQVLAVRFALSLPGVSTVLTETHSMEHLLQLTANTIHEQPLSPEIMDEITAPWKESQESLYFWQRFK